MNVVVITKRRQGMSPAVQNVSKNKMAGIDGRLRPEEVRIRGALFRLLGLGAPTNIRRYHGVCSRTAAPRVNPGDNLQTFSGLISGIYPQASPADEQKKHHQAQLGGRTTEREQ